MVFIIEILKKIPLFDGLEETDLKKISEVVKERALPTGTVLFKEGEKGDCFYLLKNGTVDVFKKDGDSDKKVTSISHNDESSFFGEMALIEGAPRNATIKTATECDVLEIDKVNFDMLLRLNSFIALRIMTALTKRFRSESEGAKEEAKVGKIITVFSPKGGSGKTVFAANLAAGIAKHTENKVLLVDLDLQFGDMAFMLGLKAKRTIAEMVDDNVEDAESFKKYLVSHSMGFEVLASPFKPEQSEMVNSNHLRRLIKIAQSIFDYIVIDTHSLFQDLTINALDISDLICLLMSPDMNHIKSMHMCLKVMETLKYPSEKIRLILNREESMYAKPKADIETALKRKFDFSLHDDWKHASDLVNDQKTVFDSNTPSQYRTDFIQCISGLTGEKIEGSDPSLLKTIKGWFGN
ncbi:MAG: pilus assembly protein CpaE [Clostridiales bacterium]|nr:pilus assembly protein CpaE [Clostridiales bacterium]MDN5281796.1 pilus assembly protein CpaE [Candidatus Ozemobacter sp.]